MTCRADLHAASASGPRHCPGVVDPWIRIMSCLCEISLVGETDQFDSYTPPVDWPLGTMLRPSPNVEQWRVNAKNTSKLFSVVAYGAETLSERLAAVGNLRFLHVRERRRYTDFYPGFMGNVKPPMRPRSERDR